MSAPSPLLVELLPGIHARLKAAIPSYWPSLGDLLDRYLHQPRPELLLPLAACQAAGGDPEAAVPAAAAILAFEISLLILDDVYDQDRPGALHRQVGPARACNFASVMQTLCFRVLAEAPWDEPVRRAIERALGDGLLEVAAGQDRDLAGPPADLDAYWSVAERKTGAAYATAMTVGALAGTEDPARVAALRRFGYHAGLAAQIFNDLRGVWFPDAIPDLERGQLTLPLLYALGFDHPDRAILAAIVKDGQVARHHQTIRQVLDRIDARAFLVWAALQQREKALAALAPIPAGRGRAFLDDFITGFFGNIDELLEGSGSSAEVGTAAARAILDRDAPPAVATTPAEAPGYRSAALSLRRALREVT